VAAPGVCVPSCKRAIRAAIAALVPASIGVRRNMIIGLLLQTVSGKVHMVDAVASVALHMSE
jgi:hypothetical protein